MSEPTPADHSHQPVDLPPFTIPQLLEHEGLKPEDDGKIPCEVKGCTARVTPRGMTRHMSSAHPPKKKRGRPPGVRKKQNYTKPQAPKRKVIIFLATDNKGREVWRDEQNEWYYVTKFDD